MKLLIGICLMIRFVSQAQTSQAILKQKEEILSTVKQWNEAFRKNDAETFFSYIHHDITLFVPSNPYRIEGKVDDREEFEYSLAKGWTKVGYFQELQVKVRLFADVALVTYHSRGSYGSDENEKVAFLKETDVLVKEEGKWKIIHIHVSETN